MASLRILTGLLAVLGVVVALGPFPATAGPTVYNTSLICADVDLSGLSIVQNTGRGRGSLKIGGAGDTDLVVELKGEGLPPSSPVSCAVLCVVDGVLDLFEFEVYDPCGETTTGGKFYFAASGPFAAGTFDGGCLLPVTAFAVSIEGPVPVVCAPGFGTFLPFPPF